MLTDHLSKPHTYVLKPDKVCIITYSVYVYVTCIYTYILDFLIVCNYE